MVNATTSIYIFEFQFESFERQLKYLYLFDNSKKTNKIEGETIGYRVAQLSQI